MNPQGTVWGDAGGAAGSSLPGQHYLTELGITNSGTPFCINDALTNNPGGYHQFCFGANALGTGIISYNAYGSASPLALECNINGAVSPCFNQATGFPAVTNNAALAAASNSLGANVYRLGFFAPGDGGGAFYSFSSSPCTLNSGAGDNGWQTPASGGGCWNLHVQQVYSVQIWGAHCDNAATDDGSFINAALASPAGAISFPQKPCRSSTTVIVPDNTQVAGSSYRPGLPVSGSAIVCDLSVTPCVQQGNNANKPSKIEGLTIARATGSVPGTAVGLLVNGGQETIDRDVFVYHQAQGVELLDTGGIGIYNHLDHVTTCASTDADLVISGVPGAYIYNSIFGCNGAFDVVHPAYVRVTGNWDATQGTVKFANTQFNLGQNTVVCGVAFQGFTGTTNVLTDFEIQGGHMETAQNAICTDNTVKGLTTVFVDGTWFGGGFGGNNHVFADLSNGSPAPAAGFNAGTTLSAFNVGPAIFTGWTDLTLAATAPIAGVRFHDSSFFNNAINITGAGSSSLQLVNNTYGGNLTLLGSYGIARASGIFQAGGFTNSTTAGSIEAIFPGPNQNSTTNVSTACKLALGGNSTGITYTQQPVCEWSMIGNTVNVDLYFSITSLGGLTGSASITGALPYNAASSNVAASTLTCMGCAALTSPVVAQPGAAGKIINLYEYGATGINTITNTNIPAGPTVLTGRVSYLVNVTP